MKKKILSLLLALCFVMALVPMTAFAAGTTDSWDGTADTSWYDENETEFHLQTAEQLAGWQSLSMVIWQILRTKPFILRMTWI